MPLPGDPTPAQIAEYEKNRLAKIGDDIEKAYQEYKKMKINV